MQQSKEFHIFNNSTRLFKIFRKKTYENLYLGIPIFMIPNFLFLYSMEVEPLWIAFVILSIITTIIYIYRFFFFYRKYKHFISNIIVNETYLQLTLFHKEEIINLPINEVKILNNNFFLSKKSQSVFEIIFKQDKYFLFNDLYEKELVEKIESLKQAPKYVTIK